MGQGSLITVNPIYFDSINGLMRLDFPNLVDGSGKKGFTEIYNFNNNTVYQLCNVCTVYTNPLPVPKYFREQTDIEAPLSTNKLPFIINGETCSPYQKNNPPNGGIVYVWVTLKGVVCRAERTDGTTYDFTNVKSGAPDSSVFVPPSTAKCPTQKYCSSPVDLVLVLDESGSIHREEWAQLITFSTGVVNSFIIGPNNTQIGLVFFSGVQYATGEDPASCCGLSDPALPINFDNDTIIKFLLNHQQTGGHTCINCGIKTATTYEPNRNRPIQVPKIMLVLTDGYNNRMTDFFAIDIANAKAQGWQLFAIGVRNASIDQLNQIASSPNNVFNISDFSQLETIAKKVIYSLCSAYPTITPCGPTCKGKCACGGQCLCPDQCNAPDLCSKGTCVQGVSGSQCLYTNTFCDPFATGGDLCKQNICQKSDGKCLVVTKNCTLLTPDSCYSQSCDPSIGCTLKDNCPPIPNQPGTNTPSVCYNRVCSKGQCTVSQKNCTDGNKCATPSCDPILGCISSPINCDDNNACTVDTCDKVAGCQYKAIDCPSKEFLNSTNFRNNLCSTYQCDPKVGCTSTPRSCNDSNICTVDSCDPTNGACINAPVTCPPPQNKCQVSVCDPIAGCMLTPKNCDDNNFCTTDTCDINTGNCVNTKIVCPANATNTCVENICDPNARKCVLRPKVTCPTQPVDKCFINSCTNGACAASAYLCPLLDLCSTSFCDPVKGCINQPKDCNDRNPCTKDFCDTATGSCVNQIIPGCNNVTCANCTSPNPCMIYKCENGTCLISPFTCPSSKCATIVPTPTTDGKCVCTPTNPVNCSASTGPCGSSVCDPLTGQCGTVNNRVCDDRDPCTNDLCTVVNGKANCTFTQISCPGDSPCSRKKCISPNGVPTCVNDTASNTLNCTATGCGSSTCDSGSGKCVFSVTPCPTPSTSNCDRNLCNPINGQCEATVGLTCPATDPAGCGTGGVCILQSNGQQSCKYNANCPLSENACVLKVCKQFSNGTVCQSTNFNCDDNNPCTTDTCVPDGVDDNNNPKSKCVSTPIPCGPATDPCTLNVCVNVNGKGVCQQTPISCNSTSKCLTGKCVVESGKGVCKFNETICGKPDNCTNFVCTPATGCSKVSRCDDKNPCTDDFCDVKTGKCTFVNKVCNSTSLCRKGVCDPNVGCVQQPIDCAKDKNVTALDSCHFAICVNTTGCVISVVPNSLDACGFCNKPGLCNVRKSKVPAGAIAGAVIGGAVVAGIVALGIGLFAASSGAAAFTPGTQVQMMGGSNNPLYTDGDTGGTNPFNDTDYQGMDDN